MRPTYHHAKRDRSATFTRRKSGTEITRWYRSEAWDRLRRHRLMLEPLCRFHARRGERVRATTVDHVRPHKGDKALFFSASNLQSLCDHCHNAVKQAMEHSRFRPVGADGWPLQEGGVPDPRLMSRAELEERNR